MFGSSEINRGFAYIEQLAQEIHALRLEIAKNTAALQSLQITGERDGEDQPFKITAEPIIND